MEELAAGLVIFPFLAALWGIIVIIVTFKVWSACNTIGRMANQLQAMSTDQRAANTALLSELQRINQR